MVKDSVIQLICDAAKMISTAKLLSSRRTSSDWIHYCQKALKKHLTYRQATYFHIKNMCLSALVNFSLCLQFFFLCSVMLPADCACYQNTSFEGQTGDIRCCMGNQTALAFIFKASVLNPPLTLTIIIIGAGHSLDIAAGLKLFHWC